MKKIKTLGIATMIILVLAIGILAVLAALGFFETVPNENENSGSGEISGESEFSGSIDINPEDEPSKEVTSLLEWQTSETSGDITAAIKTDLGDIVIKLADCSAAEKFIALDNSGVFDSAAFSTLAKDMFIQASVLGESFAAEETDLGCFYGAVGFVIHDSEATPSFFIITAEELSGVSSAYLIQHEFSKERASLYKEFGGIPEYEGKVLIFAQVVSGMETAKTIMNSENSGYSGGYSAAEPVKINDIEISYPTE
ncbi:MAG: peptidylprolyl isomerase [Oscillospiraceae bacterium]|nr:peptidylprolyl isomerase [Oscillospiraceae bacterium]